MQLTFIDTHATSWQNELDTLYQLLGGADNETLLPYHFLQAAFPHIGGQVGVVHVAGEIAMVLLLVPHAVMRGDNAEATDNSSAASPTMPLDSSAMEQISNREHSLTTGYVARCHPLTTAPSVDRGALQQQLAAALNVDDVNSVQLYDPAVEHAYTATSQSMGTVDIGRPSQAEAQTIRKLQQRIWGSPPEYLYPIDIHSVDFPLGTSLVARVDGEMAGFLFGFYKAGGLTLPADWHQRWHGDLRLESQVMGVLPEYRGLRIGYLLKRAQAAQALSQGLGLIHWTVDPLQYPNAALNFGLLRAVAFSFTPDYYAFRNELNRGPASRFSLTWLAASARVQAQPIHDARSTILQLAQHAEILRVNQGHQSLDFTLTAPILAIEIPANWTQLQANDADDALAWREATDRLFAHYVGSEPRKYVITDVGVDGEQRFLIAQQVTPYLWQRLEET